MVRQITFADVKEAREYDREKRREGYKTELCGRPGGTVIVKILGKSKKGEKEPVNIPEKILGKRITNRASNYEQYELLKESGIPRARTFHEIEERIKKEYKENKINKKVTIVKLGKWTVEAEDKSARVSEGSVGKLKAGGHIFFVSPIHEYTSEGEFNAFIEHEIKHIKKNELVLVN